MSHPFLSPSWMDAAKAIREKYADQATKVTTSIRMNQVITDVPDGVGSDSTIKLFIDTSSGDVVMELRRTRTAPTCTRHHRLRDGPQAVRRAGPGRRHAGLHGRQDQGAGRHDEDDGHADRRCRRTRSPRRSPARSRTSPPDHGSRLTITVNLRSRCQMRRRNARFSDRSVPMSFIRFVPVVRRYLDRRRMTPFDRRRRRAHDIEANPCGHRHRGCAAAVRMLRRRQPGGADHPRHRPGDRSVDRRRGDRAGRDHRQPSRPPSSRRSRRQPSRRPRRATS